MGFKNTSQISSSPQLIEFDISNVCNLKCKTCIRARPDYIQKKPQYLSFSDFQKIINKIPTPNIIQFCGSSEPTLNKDLTKMIDYTKDQGATKVEIFTNGTILKGKVLESLVNSKLDVLKVSIDGGDKKTYQMMRGANLDKTVNNVKKFHEKTSIPVIVESVLTNDTLKSIYKLPELVETIGGKELEIRLLNWQAANLKINAIYDPELLSKIKSKLKNLCNDKNIKLTMPVPREGDCNNCTAFKELYIDYRGDVAPCYFLNNKPIGNLLQEDFESIWMGEEMKNFRELFLRGTANKDCCCSWGLIANNKVNAG